jgi:hypothetical protein
MIVFTNNKTPSIPLMNTSLRDAAKKSETRRLVVSTDLRVACIVHFMP